MWWWWGEEGPEDREGENHVNIVYKLRFLYVSCNVCCLTHDRFLENDSSE